MTKEEKEQWYAGDPVGKDCILLHDGDGGVIVREKGRKGGVDQVVYGPFQKQPLQQWGSMVVPCYVQLFEHSSGGLDLVPDNSVILMPTYGGVRIDHPLVNFGTSTAGKSLELDLEASVPTDPGYYGTRYLNWLLKSASIVNGETATNKVLAITFNPAGPLSITRQLGVFRWPLAAFRFFGGAKPFDGVADDAFADPLWDKASYPTPPFGGPGPQAWPLIVTMARPIAVSSGGGEVSDGDYEIERTENYSSGAPKFMTVLFQSEESAPNVVNWGVQAVVPITWSGL